ncbi:hypothetical protein AAHA92_29352 [Salvia divinorum]|uniref:Uncharacterized protein n=1 Tax=Salvia divinorum TaxID=28513 RepID=A0ABD1G0P7_SALDI
MLPKRQLEMDLSDPVAGRSTSLSPRRCEYSDATAAARSKPLSLLHGAEPPPPDSVSSRPSPGHPGCRRRCCSAARAVPILSRSMKQITNQVYLQRI